jgi:hypothetical protein
MLGNCLMPFEISSNGPSKGGDVKVTLAVRLIFLKTALNWQEHANEDYSI